MKFSGARPLGALASTAMMIVPILTGIVIAIVMTASIALAAEPRPWLCRDKPVFSYDRGMEYEASARPGRQWQLFFMQFDPSGGHDGFTIVSQRDLGIRGEPLTGQLAAGRYFAVALYRAEGRLLGLPGNRARQRSAQARNGDRPVLQRRRTGVPRDAGSEARSHLGPGGTAGDAVTVRIDVSEFDWRRRADSNR